MNMGQYWTFKILFRWDGIRDNQSKCHCVSFLQMFRRGFESHFWQNLLFSSKFPREQSGAVEACWAHNPEVRRSKLRSAKIFVDTLGVPLAQRIARWTSNPKVLGSIPRWDDSFFLVQTVNVRMAEWSKAPDSRHCFAPLIESCENSGPRMRAWVQIPLLTNQFFFLSMQLIAL